ncbi:MAG: peptide chain release factor-like protein [Candidatus Omnitrophica bacterium CG11_big_fil_rev_8_21_14_0_20_45_26]|uniref:Peptide chain release factor-like protein n=1 Tax=Candidatus Abzuiibacterium crystallinum TaxID=1974748 RepID=A0A2H0LRC0_9BACT|nr:MAG: peptide chain release factor-like protein [Candidatus Omnitrophica bacterium CG11_big_fil_rev_8_21_14_0_20_45_26]PIW64567.1 MAG: peptide chain release factor-like protein [Candidatus Omnitrophica bacterium CG12_big_fil_rev_8_21_14_0_65_45_16]
MSVSFPVSAPKQAQLLERMQAVGLREEDLEEQFIRSRGPGGQHVNKSSTGVMLVHKPSQTQVRWDQERSQGLNRFFARRKLVEIFEREKLGSMSPAERKLARIRKQKKRRKRRHRSQEPPTG